MTEVRGFDIEFETGKFERWQADIPLTSMLFGGTMRRDKKKQKKLEFMLWHGEDSQLLRSYLKEKLSRE